MPTSDWFYEWVDRHMERFPRDDWPRPDERLEFWAGWRGNFVLHGVTADVAEQASVRMMADPPHFPEAHLHRLMEHVRAIWKERPREVEAPTDTIDAARRASAECPDCQGNGLTLRFTERLQ